MQTKEMRETTPVLPVTQLQQLCSFSLPEVSLELQKVCHVLLKTCQKGVSQQFFVLFIPYYNPYYKLSQKAKAEKQICTQTRPNIDFTSEQINFKTVSYRYFQQSGILKTNTFLFRQFCSWSCDETSHLWRIPFDALSSTQSAATNRTTIWGSGVYKALIE